MVFVNPPVSIYLQCASFCFLMAGTCDSMGVVLLGPHPDASANDVLERRCRSTDSESFLCVLCLGNFSDLLVVRCCLFSAYSCLFTNAIMGSPLWPQWHKPGHISIDLLCWCCCCLYVYTCSIVNLLRDEQVVPLESDEAALWHLLYRLGGLTRKVYAHEVLTRLQVVHFKEGSELPVETHFHIVYKGLVRLEVMEHGKVIHAGTDSSGCIFDFKELGLMPDDKRVRHHVIRVTAASDVTLFQFTNPAIREIANKDNLRNVWQTIFIGVLVRVATSRLHDVTQSSGGGSVRDTQHDDPNYIDPLFLPLDPSEEPLPCMAGSGRALEQPLSHLCYYISKSFSPPWPIGRHKVGFRHRLPVPHRSFQSAKVENRFTGEESLELTRHIHGGDHAPSSYGTLV